jgi:quercetin dioxygenase-like cupin family protein
MENFTGYEELIDHNVQKLGAEEGDITQIGTLRLTWKARGEKTGFQFGIYEMELPPGAAIPPHKHPFAEFFYVLEGHINFGRLNTQGVMEWLTCCAGESVLAPANAPHTTRNQSDRPARFLSVANFHHEFILSNGGRFVQKDDPLPEHPNPEDFQRFDELARRYQGYWVELKSGDLNNDRSDDEPDRQPE